MYSELGVSLPKDLENDQVNSVMVGSHFADLVIAIDKKNNNLSKKIMKDKKFYNLIKDKFHILNLKNEDEESCEMISDQINGLIE